LKKCRWSNNLRFLLEITLDLNSKMTGYIISTLETWCTWVSCHQMSSHPLCQNHKSKINFQFMSQVRQSKNKKRRILLRPLMNFVRTPCLKKLFLYPLGTFASLPKWDLFFRSWKTNNKNLTAYQRKTVRHSMLNHFTFAVCSCQRNVLSFSMFHRVTPKII
jgi:hypothetical protein